MALSFSHFLGRESSLSIFLSHSLLFEEEEERETKCMKDERERERKHRWLESASSWWWWWWPLTLVGRLPVRRHCSLLTWSAIRRQNEEWGERERVQIVAGCVAERAKCTYRCRSSQNRNAKEREKARDGEPSLGEGHC